MTKESPLTAIELYITLIIFLGPSLIIWIINFYLIVVLDNLAASLIFSGSYLAAMLLTYYLFSHFRITYYPKGRRI